MKERLWQTKKKMVFAVASTWKTPVAYPVRIMMMIFFKFRTAG
jgi:hypothetical protein